MEDYGTGITGQTRADNRQVTIKSRLHDKKVLRGVGCNVVCRCAVTRLVLASHEM